MNKFILASIKESYGLNDVAILDTFERNDSILILASHINNFHGLVDEFVTIFELSPELKYTNEHLLSLGINCLENFDNEEIKEIFDLIKAGSSLESFLEKN